MIFGEGPIIKNIAGDLNKLFLQGSRVGQPILNAEGSAAADQGTAALMAARDPVIQEISVGMSGEQSARYTVSGTPPLSLPNSIGKPLKAWSVDLLPYQEGSGDPSPDNVRTIHGTDKLNLFVEESYDQSATPKAVITLPQTVYTGTIGSEGGESRSKKIVLNGSENWVLAPHNSFFISLHQMKKYTAYVDNRICCESLSVVVNNNRLSDFSITGYADYNNTYPSQNWLYIKINDSITTLTELSAWLAQNPVTVVYELATPTTFAVPTVSIPTPTGTATTWATAEDGTVESMEVTYYKSE